MTAIAVPVASEKRPAVASAVQAHRPRCGSRTEDAASGQQMEQLDGAVLRCTGTPRCTEGERESAAFPFASPRSPGLTRCA